MTAFIVCFVIGGLLASASGRRGFGRGLLVGAAAALLRRRR
jgi:hypothetical protein